MNQKKQLPRVARFDVCFEPMVCVTAAVGDPDRLTQEEESKIIKAAAEAILRDAKEKLNEENCIFIRRYNPDAPEDR